MNILVQLSHPAHFYLYKNGLIAWRQSGHKVYVLIKSKDILEKLLQESKIPYFNILPIAHRRSKWGILMDMLVRDFRMIRFCRKYSIDLITGSTPETAQVSWLLRKDSVTTTEDDSAVVPAFAKASHYFMQCLLAPVVCDNGVLEGSAIHYPSYHELAYLHPNHFIPCEEIVTKYGIETQSPYFILRFASLNAHHDNGIKGINTEVAQNLIEILKPHGAIYITSERELEPQFEQYRIKINPLDMHHVMAFASLYIGDSQTMAAEAGVLGTPFIRFNDFVGRIGYLRELEDKYQLGFGIHASELSHDSNIRRQDGSEQPSGTMALYKAVESLVQKTAVERRELFQTRRQRMLADKIDYAKFLTWFIENYPESKEASKKADEAFWTKFK